ncbi:MAG: response regulator [Desulfobacterales bacterium]|nr:response regulator [Desulfobacterales bacterium]MDD4073425.1 response regulator [Desulfobacterales bacterium]MDD4393617.1 response regulator [Desulfobacterales bacterium]
MKILIADDDFTSRMLLQGLLQSHGTVHLAVNGREAVEAVRLALEADELYDLICLDIMMPEMDGQEALRQIRLMEETKGIAVPDRVKIIMATALADKANVIKALNHQCDYFLVKPIQKARLMEKLRNLKLIL